MCRHAWQRPRHALQRPRHACNVLGVLGMHFCKVLGVPHRRKTPLTCCLISYEAKGVVYHQASIYETRWYATPLTSQLIRQQVEEFFFDMGLLGPYKNACQGRRGRCKHAQDVAKHAQDVAKHVEDVRRCCQACLHILGSHKYIYIYIYIYSKSI